MARGSRTARDEAGTGATAGSIRLDKWIWFARFQRAREACADLVRKGHVRVNGRRVTQPGAFIRPGDVLTLALPGTTEIIEVLALAERREGSAEAALLYRRVENVCAGEGKND